MNLLYRMTIAMIPLGIPLMSAANEPLRNTAAISAAITEESSRREVLPLIDKVRRATGRFRDINVAMAEGWVQGTPCVSGPNSGAMGVHFVIPRRIGDGQLNADEPEALIYEPLPNGTFRLVGVEFIVLAADWTRLHPAGPAPSLEGNLLNLIGEPNRYGLPAFFEMHVWAWERNPNGSYADWNSHVTCDRQVIN